MLLTLSCGLRFRFVAYFRVLDFYISIFFCQVFKVVQNYKCCEPSDIAPSTENLYKESITVVFCTYCKWYTLDCALIAIQDLVASGVVEYIDTMEEETTMIAVR